VENQPRLLVTLEGYAVEGGFDRAYEPATCYSPTIALGRHRGPGDADGLWSDYEAVLDLVAQMGLAGVALTLEWARIEPRRHRVDEAALDRYARAVAHARSLGLAVTVVLVDAAWPAWLGLEAWLLPWVVPDVLEHAKRVAHHLGPDLTGIVPFANPERLVAGGYLHASGPPWRRGAREDAASADAQISAIVAGLAQDPQVGALLVKSTSLSLELSPERILEFRSANRAVDEVHVRSLLAGHGPSACARGLLVREANEWRVSAPSELLEALR
jgi:beta-glucosidase/6-phospho-beta-glucosidase/beta-galactosidase